MTAKRTPLLLDRSSRPAHRLRKCLTSNDTKRNIDAAPADDDERTHHYINARTARKRAARLYLPFGGDDDGKVNA